VGKKDCPRIRGERGELAGLTKNPPKKEKDAEKKKKRRHLPSLELWGSRGGTEGGRKDLQKKFHGK